MRTVLTILEANGKWRPGCGVQNRWPHSEACREPAFCVDLVRYYKYTGRCYTNTCNGIWGDTLALRDIYNGFALLLLGVFD